MLWLRLRRLCLFVITVGMNLLSGFGKCPACGEWNSFFEQKLDKGVTGKKETKEASTSIALRNVEYKEISRISTGFGELDRVLRWGSC